MTGKRISKSSLANKGNNIVKKISHKIGSKKKRKIDSIFDEFVDDVKAFFKVYYSMSSNFSVNEIIPKTEQDNNLDEESKEELIKFLEEISLFYYSGKEKTKQDLKENLKYFKLIVKKITEDKRIKNKKIKKKESKTSEFLKSITLKRFDRETRSIMRMIISSYELINNKEICKAKKTYDEISAKYSVLTNEKKRKIFKKVKNLEEEIYEKFFRMKRIEIEKSFDKIHSCLKKEKQTEAIKEFSKTKLFLEELPKEIRANYLNMEKEIENQIHHIKKIQIIEKINNLSKEVNKSSNYKAINRKYNNSVELFKKLKGIEKGNMFKVMKKIKQRNDEMNIKSSCEKIAKSSISSWHTHRLDEKKLFEKYNEAYKAYRETDSNIKKKLYDGLMSSYYLLIEATLAKNIRIIEKKIEENKDKKQKLLDYYIDLDELYKKLPDNKKKDYYPKIKKIYEKIISS